MVLVQVDFYIETDSEIEKLLSTCKTRTPANLHLFETRRNRTVHGYGPSKERNDVAR